MSVQRQIADAVRDSELRLEARLLREIGRIHDRLDKIHDRLNTLEQHLSRLVHAQEVDTLSWWPAKNAWRLIFFAYSTGYVLYSGADFDLLQYLQQAGAGFALQIAAMVFTQLSTEEQKKIRSPMLVVLTVVFFLGGWLAAYSRHLYVTIGIFVGSAFLSHAIAFLIEIPALAENKVAP